MEKLETLEFEVLDYLEEEDILDEDRALKGYLTYLARNCEELNNEITYNDTDRFELITDILNGDYIDKEDVNFLGNIETESFIIFFIDNKKYGLGNKEYEEIQYLIDIYGRDIIVKKVLERI